MEKKTRHEVRNALQVMALKTYLLRLKLSGLGIGESELTAIERQIERITELMDEDSKGRYS